MKALLRSSLIALMLLGGYAGLTTHANATSMHLPGLPMVAGVAMGIGAMTVVMLGLPLTSVLITAIVLQSDGVALVPLIIVAVVVAYVASRRLTPEPVVTTSSPDPAALQT